MMFNCDNFFKKIVKNKKSLLVIILFLFSTNSFPFVARLRKITPALKTIIATSIKKMASPTAEVATELSVFAAQTSLGLYCLWHKDKSKNSYFRAVAFVAAASGLKGLSSAYSVVKKNKIPLRFWRSRSS